MMMMMMEEEEAQQPKEDEEVAEGKLRHKWLIFCPLCGKIPQVKFSHLIRKPQDWEFHVRGV